VFAGPVDATEKMTGTGPNATGCNRTIGCGCLLWAPGWVAGCPTFKIFKNRAKTGCNPLQPVFYVYRRQCRYLDHIYLFYLLIIRWTPSLQTQVGHFFQAPIQLPSTHRHNSFSSSLASHSMASNSAPRQVSRTYHRWLLRELVDLGIWNVLNLDDRQGHRAGPKRRDTLFGPRYVFFYHVYSFYLWLHE
jgi:hypothetical protein